MLKLRGSSLAADFTYIFLSKYVAGILGDADIKMYGVVSLYFDLAWASLLYIFPRLRKAVRLRRTGGCEAVSVIMIKCSTYVATYLPGARHLELILVQLVARARDVTAVADVARLADDVTGVSDVTRRRQRALRRASRQLRLCDQ